MTTEEKENLLKDLETAYYSGTLRVKTGDKEVWYDSRSKLRIRINELKAELNPSQKKKTVVLTYTSKGL